MANRFSRFLKLIIFLNIVSFSAFAEERPEINENRLSAGITGTRLADATWSHTEMLKFVKVQELFFALAQGPRDQVYVENALSGLEFGLADIMANKLLREENGLFYLNFNFFTQRDLKLFYDVSEKFSRTLTEAYIEAWPQFRKIFQDFDQPAISEGNLAYIILGMISLDWDGLSLTEQLGYRQGAFIVGEGNAYTPWAKERGNLTSLQYLYWGSHNDPTIHEKFVFSSFGDHHSSPRHGIPDSYWFGKMELPKADETLNAAYEKSIRAAMQTAHVQYAELLKEVKTKPKTIAEIASLMKWSVDVTAKHLDYLGQIQVLNETAEGYQAAIPVLEVANKEMIERARTLSWQIMENWLLANYEPMKTQFTEVSAIKQGVPYELVYTQIWHYIFGLTNRDLVRAGLFANPYGDERRYKGFFSAIWAKETLADFPLIEGEWMF